MAINLSKDQLSEHTERYKNTGLSPAFLEEMAKVIAALQAADYDPYAQLTGFVRTENARYITRAGGARDMVLKMDAHDIKIFLKHYKTAKSQGSGGTAR